MLTVEPHPLLDLGAFVARHPSLGESPDWLRALMSPASDAPVKPDDNEAGRD